MTSATKRLRAAVFKRADGACECGCGAFITEESGRLDHFFGRAKAPESMSTCWAICLGCDQAKTLNYPSARYWLERFVDHAQRHGYSAEVERAFAKIDVLRAKGRAA